MSIYVDDTVKNQDWIKAVGGDITDYEVPPGNGKTTISKAPDRKGPRKDRGLDEEHLRIRAEILAKKPKCVKCGKPADTVDHKRKRSHGGKNEKSNYRPMCLSCNSRDGAIQQHKDAGHELSKHLPGQHDQMTHGRRTGQPTDSNTRSMLDTVSGKRGITPEDAAKEVWDFYGSKVEAQYRPAIRRTIQYWLREQRNKSALEATYRQGANERTYRPGQLVRPSVRREAVGRLRSQASEFLNTAASDELLESYGFYRVTESSWGESYHTLHRIETDMPATPDELEAATTRFMKESSDGIKRMVKDAHVFVRVDETTLDHILGRGELTTVHDPEAHSSISEHGDEPWEDPEAPRMSRRRLEERLYPAGDYPIYGHLSSNFDGDLDLQSGHSWGSLEANLSFYGDVAIRLKENVRERTTFTVGDSHADQEWLVPAPVNKPHLIASGGIADTTRARTVNDVAEYGGPAYVEAQIHGPVRLEDIEAIVFEVEPEVELRRRLLRLRIPWRVTERNKRRDVDRVRMTFPGATIPRITKHLPGQHEQRRHGIRGGVDDAEAHREARRVAESVRDNRKARLKGSPAFRKRVLELLPEYLQVIAKHGGEVHVGTGTTQEVHGRKGRRYAIVDPEKLKRVSRPALERGSHLEDLPEAVRKASMDHLRYLFSEDGSGITATQAYDRVLQNFRDVLGVAMTDTAKQENGMTYAEDGMGWYHRVNAQLVGLAGKVNLKPQTVFGIVAATSPGQDWDDNIAIATQLAEFAGAMKDKRVGDLLTTEQIAKVNGSIQASWKKAHEPGGRLPEEWKTLDAPPVVSADDALDGKSNYMLARIAGGKYGWQAGHGYRPIEDGFNVALHDADIDDYLPIAMQGMKVRSFLNCIRNPDNADGFDDTAIDVHMINVAHGGIATGLEALLTDKNRLSRLKSGGAAGYSIGAYIPIAHALRQATYEWNAAHPDRLLTPLQAQAVMWTWWIDKHKPSEKRKKTKLTGGNKPQSKGGSAHLLDRPKRKKAKK